MPASATVYVPDDVLMWLPSRSKADREATRASAARRAARSKRMSPVHRESRPNSRRKVPPLATAVTGVSSSATPDRTCTVPYGMPVRVSNAGRRMRPRRCASSSSASATSSICGSHSPAAAAWRDRGANCRASASTDRTARCACHRCCQCRTRSSSCCHSRKIDTMPRRPPKTLMLTSKTERDLSGPASSGPSGDDKKKDCTMVTNDAKAPCSSTTVVLLLSTAAVVETSMRVKPLPNHVEVPEQESGRKSSAGYACTRYDERPCVSVPCTEWTMGVGSINEARQTSGKRRKSM
mmetsp:Transcript_3823/g.12348  ORF Transcript_3823/g.12348 Transcript_3823/m.12348 type:complete len:294 (+) Transcript_3823:1057-1938(+)